MKFLGKIFALAAFTLLAFHPGASAQTWDLNDVSYLFPLPNNATDTNYLKIKDFVPLTWITQTLADQNGMPFTVDAINQSSTSPDQSRAQAIASFNSIHLLAVRIDPCFKDLFSDACRPQIRAVWQPLDKSLNSVDGTVHTFSDLSADEFRSVTTQLLQLKAKYKISTSGLALQVHPGFKQNGFLNDFTALLKPWLQTDRLTRIAFMKLLGAEFQWRFLSFNIKDQKLIPIQIPIHTGTVQTFAVHGGSIPPGTLELSEEELARVKNGDSLDQVLLEYSLRIENPRLNLPGTTDCLSCHAAGGVKGAAVGFLHLSEIPTVASVVGVIGKYNLKNSSNNLQDPIHFRAFGYVFRNPSISDRVIIESAMVADQLNK